MTGAAKPLVLASHALCPYVQRVAIVLDEKGLPFERRDVDLARKPDWFRAISPLGRTPVLQVGDEALFESAVICEYLDETMPQPPLLPDAPLARARHRGWVAFGSAMLDQVAALYNAPDDATFGRRTDELQTRWQQVEAALGGGPYFAGTAFGLVDASFAPLFRYFDAFDALGVLDGVDAPREPHGLGAAEAGAGTDAHAHAGSFWSGLPKLCAWRRALAARPSVIAAASPGYPDRLRRFLRDRPSALGRRAAAVMAAG